MSLNAPTLARFITAINVHYGKTVTGNCRVDKRDFGDSSMHVSPATMKPYVY